MKQRSVRFERIGTRYRQVALVVFNTLLLLFVANVVLGVVYWLRDGRNGGSESGIRMYHKYGREQVLQAYPDMAPEEVDQLLTERSEIQYEYQPYSQFRERSRNGKFINVSEHGFRKIQGQREWPPDPGRFNVFVFGGSTTFGYGIGDEQTIPSHLQALLQKHSEREVAVYNFGRAYFFSRLELALFQELAAAGHPMDLAIFIDGLNEFTIDARSERPAFTDQLAKLMHQAQNPSTRAPQPSSIPLVRFANSIKQRVSGTDRIIPKTPNVPPTVLSAQGTLDRYFVCQNLIRAVAQSFDVESAFVWQPVPMFQPGDGGNPFLKSRNSDKLHREGYELMRKHIEASTNSVVWCADLNSRVPSPRYVDKVHYTGKMCETIALRIASDLNQRGFLK